MKKIVVEWLNLLNPHWQCFVVGARFFLINFSSLLPEGRVAKKLFTRIESVHQIINTAGTAVSWLWPSKKNICQNLSIYVTLLRLKIFFWKIVFSPRTVLLFSVRLRKISVSISILWINELPHPEDHFHWYHPHHLRHSPYWCLFGFDNNILRKKYSRRDTPPPPIYCKYPTFFMLFVFWPFSSLQKS